MRVIVIFLILSFVNVYSQTTFFVRPTVDSKVFVGTADNTLSNGMIFDNMTASNSYFQVNNKLLSYRNVIHLGINFGLSLNNRHAIEFGWRQDGAGSSWQTKMMTWDTTSYGLQTFSNNGSLRQSYISYHRFVLNYQYQITSDDNKTSFGLSFGTGLLFNPNKKKNTSPPSIIFGSYSSNEALTHLDENITMPIQETEMMPVARLSGYLSIGLYNDIRIKQKYILSASLTYLQGFKYMEYSVHRYHIIDNNVEKRFNYTSASSGSGLYLQISRKFQLYPLKKKKKSS